MLRDLRALCREQPSESHRAHWSSETAGLQRSVIPVVVLIALALASSARAEEYAWGSYTVSDWWCSDPNDAFAQQNDKGVEHLFDLAAWAARDYGLNLDVEGSCDPPKIEINGFPVFKIAKTPFAKKNVLGLAKGDGSALALKSNYAWPLWYKRKDAVKMVKFIRTVVHELAHLALTMYWETWLAEQLASGELTQQEKDALVALHKCHKGRHEVDEANGETKKVANPCSEAWARHCVASRLCDMLCKSNLTSIQKDVLRDKMEKELAEVEKQLGYCAEAVQDCGGSLPFPPKNGCTPGEGSAPAGPEAEPDPEGEEEPTEPGLRAQTRRVPSARAPPAV